MRPDESDGPAFGFGLLAGLILFSLLSGIRRLTRRGGSRAHAPAASLQAEQLMRLEQAIDAIALEVERISEGQRFTARLMAEGQGRSREAVLRDS